MKWWPYFLAVLTFILFIVLAIVYEHPSVVSFDETISDVFIGNGFISFFHFFGETTWIMSIALLLIIYLWIHERNYRGILFVVLAVGVGNSLNQIIKHIIERPRPEMVNQLTSFSFPSGHAMVGLLYLFTVAYILSEVIASKQKRMLVWVIAIFLTLLVGLSRIAENYHYPSDVLAGWGLGFSWFMVCVFWYESRKRKFQRINK